MSNTDILNVLTEVEQARCTIFRTSEEMLHLVNRLPNDVLRNHFGQEDYKKFIALKTQRNRAFAILKQRIKYRQVPSPSTKKNTAKVQRTKIPGTTKIMFFDSDSNDDEMFLKASQGKMYSELCFLYNSLLLRATNISFFFYRS